MELIQILKWLAVGITLVYGLYAMIKPGVVGRFAGLETSGNRGITEIRAALGGTFLGLAIAVMVLNNPAGFKMLGICYAAIAVIRAVSMALDRTADRSNAISLIVETGLAILLVL